MIKKNKATNIAKIWNELHAGSTEQVKTNAVVVNRGKGDYAVEILPTAENTGTAFYHTEEIADFSRTFKVSSLVSVRDGIAIGKFF